ncbi:hypothetical protein Ahy_B02g059914 isoform C [Arachis hypogaea]|uniref:Uncharacterized protein n=1 Tax=Arachis hypogaea TaxID=3818 RepID=A0A445AHL8_ARAHY|nr:hypothetical protein Ahy_B02g059914 isoform C [Arachis hypogaea]
MKHTQSHNDVFICSLPRCCHHRSVDPLSPSICRARSPFVHVATALKPPTPALFFRELSVHPLLSSSSRRHLHLLAIVRSASSVIQGSVGVIFEGDSSNNNQRGVGDFSPCLSPRFDSKEHYDFILVIDLQERRLKNLQLPDFKNIRIHHHGQVSIAGLSSQNNIKRDLTS